MSRAPSSLPALCALVACRGPDPCDALGLEVHPAEAMPAALVATWHGGHEHLAWSTDGTASEVWGGPGDPRRAVVVGPGAGASVWLAVPTASGELCETAATTGPLPGSPPTLVTATYGETAPERWVIGTVLSPHAAVVIADRFTGLVVWHLPLERDLIASRAAPVDGSLRHDATNRDMTFEVSELRQVGADGERERTLSLRRGHHAWSETEGGIAYLSSEVRETWVDAMGAEVPVAGDAIARVDDEGNQDLLFDTFDALDPEPGPVWYRGYFPDGYDWTHASGLSATPDGFLMSLRGLPALLEVEDGLVSRHFGTGGTHAVELASGALDAPHSPSLTSAGTLLLLNYDQDGDYAVELEVLEDRAVERWQYGRGLGLHSVSNGVAQRLEGGTTLVMWTAEGRAREVGPEGDVRWEMSSGESTFNHIELVAELPWP